MLKDIKIPKPEQEKKRSKKLKKKLSKKELESEDRAIQLGVIWMKKSKDKEHNFEHSSRILQNSLKIYEELKEKQPKFVKSVDENLIKLVCTWHDAYKATTHKNTFLDLFTEGNKSSKITEEELTNYLNSKRLARILKVIRAHNKIYFYFWRLNRIDPLLRILLEADGLDGTRKDRFRIGWEQNPNIFSRIQSIILYWGFILFYGHIFPKTDHGKRVFKKNRNQKFLTFRKKK